MKSRIVKNNQFSKIELILDQRFAENQEEILKKIQIVKKLKVESGSILVVSPTIIHKAPGLRTRCCPNSGPERVCASNCHQYIYEGIPSIWVHMHGVRHRKSIPRKIVLENLNNKMYGCPVGNISTKCCDYLNIPMS
ncbi:hypothetical protein H8356DRAFT_1349287 [Neocallimastix lanati (nom. inval.)]|nr:hypothetical protein H8356DRAFT_1349287 [Neocallimastix sp. JGI-2020a]